MFFQLVAHLLGSMALASNASDVVKALLFVLLYLKYAECLDSAA